MTNLKARSFLCSAAALSVCLLAPGALAATQTWSGAGADNFWGTGANWSGTAPANNDSLTFNGSARLSNTNNLSNLTIGSLRLNNGNFVLGGNPLTLNPTTAGIFTNSAGSNTLAMDLTVTPAAKYWWVAPNSELRLAGAVTNGSLSGTSAGWLCLTNGGTVRILNTAKSARGMDLFQGTVIIDGGLVDAINDGIRFKPPTGSTVSVVLTNNGTLRIGGGGNFRMGHNGTVIGAAAGPGSLSQMTLSSGTLELYGSAVSVMVGDLVAGATGVFNQNGGLVWGSAGSGNTLTIGNAVNADGTYNLNGGVLWIAQVKQGNAGATNVVFNFNGGTLRPTVSSATFFQGLLTANIQSGGAVIDTTNLNITIGQSLGGSGSLTKLGSGTLTLSGSCTYSGSTVVSNGTLNITPSTLLGGGALRIGDGATLTLSNPVSTLSASALTLGTSGTSTLKLDFPYGNAGMAPLSVTTLSGNGNVVINITGQNLTAGQFPLIQFSSATGLGNFHLGSVPPGISASLVATATSLNLNIASVVKSVVWSGAANNQWDTSSIDWQDLGNGYNPTNYAQAGGFGDMVTFDDSAVGSAAINLTLPVTPVSMTFNNNGLAYSFAGAGKISGVGGLTLNGNGSVTLGTANDYTGGTVLNAGTLYLGADQALGQGSVLLNLGTLASASTAPHTLANGVTFNANNGLVLGDGANNGTLTLAGSVDLGGSLARTLSFNSDVVFAGAVSNGGWATKTGPGRLIVSGQAQQGGLVTQNQGDVIIDGGQLNSTDGWRMQNNFPGTTLLFAVTNGGVFTLSSPSGNLRVGLAGGDGTANNILDISGTVALTSTGGNGRVDLGLSGANDVVYLRSGGRLACYSITGNAPAYTELNLDGGTLSPIANQGAFLQGLTNVYVRNGGVTIDTTNYNITIAQSLQAGGSGGLTKVGPGVLTLTGTNTYAGLTLVNAGKLVLAPGAAAPGGIQVGANAALAFLSAPAGLSVSAPGVTNAEGSALEAQFTGNSGNPTAPAGVINNLVLNGVVKVNLAGSGLSTGQFPLFAYGTISGSGSLVTGQLPQGLIASLITNTAAKTIDLVVSGVAPDLWVGQNGATWSTAATNWTVLGTPAAFQQGDSVRFDDSASNALVTLTQALTPGSVVVSNTALSYQFSGAGSLAGNSSLVKDGAGSLSLNASNAFLGAITVQAGTLIAGTNTALGATNGATVVLPGATLDVGAQNLDSEPVVLAGSGVGGRGALVNAQADQNNALKNVTLNGDTAIRADALFGIRTAADTDVGLVGNGYKLTKLGTNALNLNGGQANSGTTIWDTDLGDIDVLEGTLSFERRMTMGRAANTIHVAPGATLRLFALNAAVPVQTKAVSLTNASLVCSGNVASDGCTFAGSVTLNGPSNTVAALAGTTFTLNGPWQGSGSLTSSGLIVLGGVNTFTGSTVVSNGTLQLGATAQFTGSTNITVQSGATFDVSNLGTWALGASQTLSGFGTVNGSVQANGTVAPGGAPGTLTFNNNLVLAGTTVMEVSKASGLTNDVITVNGTLTFGGQLKVVMLGTTPLAVNDTFKLFNFTGSPAGSFSLSLPAGYTWDTTQLAVNGTIKVTGLANPPQIRGISLSGNSFTLSGTGGTPGATYYVYGATNVVLPLANWTPVLTNTFAPDGNFTNSLPVDPGAPQGYYLLKLP